MEKSNWSLVNKKDSLASFEDVVEKCDSVEDCEVYDKLLWHAEMESVDAKVPLLYLFHGMYAKELRDLYIVIEYGDFTLCAGIQKDSAIIQCSYFKWASSHPNDTVNCIEDKVFTGLKIPNPADLFVYLRKLITLNLIEQAVEV